MRDFQVVVHRGGRGHGSPQSWVAAAMASRDAERAEVTQRAMLEWAEFNWRLMMGEYGVETALASVDLPTIKTAFGRSAWFVQDLYTQGSPRLRAQIKDVAFGTILHTLQDSFAEGHAERASALRSRRCSLGERQLLAPGEIAEFHSYVHQDHDLHATSNRRGAFEEHLQDEQDEPDVVEIGRALLACGVRGGHGMARRSTVFFRVSTPCIQMLDRPLPANSIGSQMNNPRRTTHRVRRDGSRGQNH